MRVLLVLCDTQGADELSKRLARAIDEYGESLPLSDASHLVYTDRGSEEVFENLKHALGAEHSESLLVLTVPRPYTGRAPTKVRLWMEQLREMPSGGDSPAQGHARAEP